MKHKLLLVAPVGLLVFIVPLIVVTVVLAGGRGVASACGRCIIGRPGVCTEPR